MARIAVTGIWHQGMVVAASLAELGHAVVGVCETGEDARTLASGEPLLHEPGVDVMLEKNLHAGRLRFTTSYDQAVPDADFVFVCTDTPVDAHDDSDLQTIFGIAAAIAPFATGSPVLCVTAQVPVGTTDRIASSVVTGGGTLAGYAYVPEFLRLGTALDTFWKADRFVIGCDDPAVADRVEALYAPLGRPIVRTGVRTAEMAKHASNAFLATSISFANEIADLSEGLGADAADVMRILKLDRRIGPYAFLSPGLGFAGGTLGREIRALQRFGLGTGVSTPLLDAVWRVNAERPALVAARLEHTLGGLQGKSVALFGLTYKPGTSTLRRAVSLLIAGALLARGATLSAHDPLADTSGVDMPQMRMAADPYDAAAGADAIVLITDWHGIEALDYGRLRREMRGDVLFDTRGVLDAAMLTAAGFRPLGVGRP